MKYIIKKGCALIITLFIVSFVTFLAFQIVPGDSAVASLGIDATPQQVAALQEKLGYHKPILERYGIWVRQVVQGDFGMSTDYHMPVKDLVKERFQVTIILGVLSLIFTVVIAIPVGILTARHQGKLLDKVISFGNQVGMAIPPFFLGILFSFFFGVVLKWFTPGAYVGINEDFFESIKYLMFPAFAVAIPKIAMMVKFVRGSVIRQLGLNYVQTARSKGNNQSRILWRHVLRNAMVPVVTYFALVCGEVLAGIIVIEQVFSLPGLGRLLVVAIGSRDLAVVQVIVLYMALVVILVNYFVDIVYQWVDPRVKGTFDF